MPFVFTVFFCGTGSNSFDVKHPSYPMGELVSTLASHHEGKEFVDWIIIDGPGSGNLQEDDKWVKPGNYSQPRGAAFGSGWEENVAHAIAIIKGNSDWKRVRLTKKEWTKLKEANVGIGDWEWSRRIYDYPGRRITPQDLQMQKVKLLRPRELPEFVNIVGWSRGGISCHMLANAMFNDPVLKNIPVKILTFDPVPGPGNFQEHRTTLKRNVREYIGIYARDERSLGFTPCVPQFAQRTQVKILPILGRHATLVGNPAIDGQGGQKLLFEPGILVRDFAEKTLTTWGTKLKESKANEILLDIDQDRPMASELIKALKTKSFNIPGKLELTLRDIDSLYSRMVLDEALYAAMQKKYYTKLVPDGLGPERTVGVGKDGTSTEFTKVKHQGNPEFNLAPVGEYLSWHHQDAEKNLNEQNEQAELDNISQASNLFPTLASGFTTALAHEPVLLNGMKVLFDQQTSVYPVSLQIKDSEYFNSSLAQGLGKNNNLSRALNLKTWADVLKLEINYTHKIKDKTKPQKVKLNYKNTSKDKQGRLEIIASQPWKLDQGNEGNCGFAAVMMAMLFLDRRKSGQTGVQNRLKELLNAIYYQNKYRKGTVTKDNPRRNAKQKRITADPGEIKTRIIDRLKRYKNIEQEEATYSPKIIADYVLIIGLMLFFEDYMLHNKSKAKVKFWEDNIMKFNDKFAVLKEQKEQRDKYENERKTRRTRRIKSMDDSETLIPGHKKGDLALTEKALEELCDFVKTKKTNHSHKLEKVKQVLEKPIHKLYVSSNEKDEEERYCVLVSNWGKIEDKDFPCILGVSFGEMFFDNKKAKAERQKFAEYNYLQHWIF
ncbi:MAG: hypothetical protein AAF652_14950, partial [Cyanobacteria bacterium P01_C01_bin.72]